MTNPSENHPRETSIVFPVASPESSTSPSSMKESSIMVSGLQDEDRSKLRILDEIFRSKNDNDPRMDQDLKNLSEPLKATLKSRYQELKPELRNERGTIAFLLGRELRDGRGTLADLEFLKSILMEKPCMSLSDCSRTESGQSSEEEHLQGVYETTANYPQLMDLRYLKQSLESGNLTDDLKRSVISTLEAALHSPNPVVVKEARAILDSVR